MEELIKNVPNLLAVSADLYLTYKTFQLFYWLWNDQVPPERRLLNLNMDRKPMKILNPAFTLEKPRYEWSCLPEKDMQYYPEIDKDKAPPISKYGEAYWDLSRKHNPIFDLNEIPAPSEFVPPPNSYGFRIGCRPYNEDVTWCVKIDYLKPKDVDVISYMSSSAKDLYKLSEADNTSF
jgi:hypothetical protein